MRAEDLEDDIWLVICEGERRLEYNNNQAEGRRHMSYSNYNDKIDTLQDDMEVAWIILDREMRASLRKAIGQLEPRQQDLVRDIYYRGYSPAEIARRDCVHRSSVSKRLARVLARLRSILQ